MPEQGGGEYQKFLPEDVPAWQMPFWEGLRAHRLVMQRCSSCGTLRHVPKELCRHCLTLGATWSDVSELGELYTYAVVHRAPTPAFQEEAPYVIAHVTMDAGPRMTGRLRVDPSELVIGMRVRAAYNDVTDGWTLLEFVPA